MTVAEGEWHKLDRRTVLVTVLRSVPAVVIGGVIGASAISGGIGPGRAAAIVIPAALLLIVIVAAIDDVRWHRTRYRVLPERVELHEGIFVRSKRSLARDRIRSVDLTAPLLLRVFGLMRVQIGTGEQAGTGESSLMLYPVLATEADRLRRELLERAPTGVSEEPGATSDGVLAIFEPSWVRFAPMSITTPLFGAAFFGLILQVAEWFGLQAGVLSWAGDLLRSMSWTGALLTVLGTGVAVGVIASVAVFVEMWWQYRLEREPNGTLRVRRGLLTTRSVSLEEERLRGVEVLEGLGHRLLGGARLDAVATGLVERKSAERTEHKTLLPPAPRWDVDQVAAAVLREQVPPTESVRLQKHPLAARGRRIRWALLAVAVPVAVLLVLGVTGSVVLLHLAWIAALVLTPIAVVLASDAYHNLGHGLTGGYLVTRSGTLRRSTVALQRNGVIGWTARQSIFQRHRGLITLTATTAAGAGAYAMYDMDESEGLAFAEAAVPDLFGPFLERD